MDFDTRNIITKATVILPAWICLYSFNPLSIITKHVIMLYLYKSTFLDQRISWLQNVVLSMIAQDYLREVARGNTWSAIIWSCIVISQCKLQTHHALVAYLMLLLCFDWKKSLDLFLLFFISTKTPAIYGNVLGYLFLQRLFSLR